MTKTEIREGEKDRGTQRDREVVTETEWQKLRDRERD